MIPITRCVFDDDDRKSILLPLESGWVVQGPRVAEFEQTMEHFTGAAHAVAVTSCTAGLHLAISVLGVGPGDEVLVPSFTYVATANAVEYVGARPVLCDVDLDSFNIDPKDAEARLTSSTRAIIPVHLFGLSAAMEPLLAMARAHSIVVIEDAACGLGTRYRGSHVGTLGEIGVFSFHPRKTVTTGEGGMITTNDATLASTLRSLRDHGASRSDRQRHEDSGALLPEFDHVGFNYRMTDIQGALGVSQMRKADWIIEGRRRRAGIYDATLAEVPWLVTPSVPSDSNHTYQSYVCRIRLEAFGGDLSKANAFRTRLMGELERAGIACRQGTHAVHLLGYYRRRYGYRPEDCGRAWEADRLSLTIPLYAQMTDEEQERVVSALSRFGP